MTVTDNLVSSSVCQSPGEAPDSRLESPMRNVNIALFIFLGLSLNGESVEPSNKKPLIEHPMWYIKILDWSFYVALDVVAIIHNVAIENTGSIGYQHIKVRVNYYSTTGSNYGIQVGQEIEFLPVTLPPKARAFI